MRRLCSVWIAAILLTGCAGSTAPVLPAPEAALRECAEKAVLPAEHTQPQAELQALLRRDALCRCGLSESVFTGNTVQFFYIMPPETLSEQKLLLQRYAAAWADSVSGLTPIQQILHAVTRLRAVCTYGEDGSAPHTAYGALIEGKAVCDGYAEAFLLLCNAADIPCLLVSGTAEGIPHAWNLVFADGHWYHTDCTWSDTAHSSLPLLCSDSTIHQSRFWDESAYPKADGTDRSFAELAKEYLSAEKQ